MAICIYCLNTIERPTRDHVFAKGWYPDNSSSDYQRWTVPACAACNNRFSKIEQDVLSHLILCVDPKHLQTKGPYEKTLRAMNPGAAQSADDATCRQRMRDRILKDTFDLEEFSKIGVLPSFSANWDRGSRTGVLVSAKALEQLARKWIRGLHYLTLERTIESDDVIQVFHPPQHEAQSVLADYLPRMVPLSQGQTIQVKQATASDETGALTFYAIEVWCQFKVYGAVDETLTTSKQSK